MAKRKSSSNGGPNRYKGGYKFWKNMAFWRDPTRCFSERAKDYYETWLEEMRVNERALTRL